MGRAGNGGLFFWVSAEVNKVENAISPSWVYAVYLQDVFGRNVWVFS